MKINLSVQTLVLIFLFSITRLHAQQTNADDKTFEEVKIQAEKGNAKAQFYLGLVYASGGYIAYASTNRVKQDYAEAMKWYRKAADQNDADAQNNLAVMYEKGQGVTQSYAEAVKWYHKAAEQNQIVAQYNLGSDFVAGNGVPIDYVQGYKWMNLALAQGSEPAKRYLPILESQMTQEQIAEAQQLTREFKPRKESSSGNSTSPENPSASGSGFFITDDGYLISNYHVVKEATKVRLVTSAGTVNAKVIQVDTANDLALLKADGKFAALPIASSRTAHLGNSVSTVGFPDPGLQGFAPKFARGEIASLSGAGDDARYFQISVPVQHGNSGGALVDEHGNVVGVVSARLGVEIVKALTSDELPENVNYAVKSSFLLSFLESAPDVSAKLKEPVTIDRKFEDVVKSAQDAAVLVLVY
jgi:TPR repeat protein